MRLAPHTRLLLLAALLAGGAPAHAQNQDAAKMLNLFQGLMKPAQPGQPVQPVQQVPSALQPQPAANPLANMLGNAAAPAAVNTGNPATRGADLIGMLSQSVQQIDEPHEIEIGRQLSAVLLGSKPLYPDMAVQHYVNQLGRWISLQSARPDLPWTFAVLDDPGFNAFAAPGGFVFITKGLLDRVLDEGELAGILAHEINHVTGKHHLTAMGKTARLGVVTQVIGSRLSTNSAVTNAVSAQLLSLGKDLYAKGLDRDDEFEADRNGVVLAARSGFDPYGLVAVLLQLRTAAPDNPMFALQLSTHPPSQLRLDQLEQAMGTRLDALSGKPPITVAQRMERMQAAAQASASAAARSPAVPAAPARKQAQQKKQ